MSEGRPNEDLMARDAVVVADQQVQYNSVIQLTVARPVFNSMDYSALI